MPRFQPMPMPVRLPMLLLVAVAIAAAGPVAATPGCAGVVFEDRDGDSRHDPAEPGIAGVAVHDGARLVRTDAAGRFVLASSPGAARPEARLV